MGVALENARLFDETQRLFKESEQRAAELAIINSVQEGAGRAAQHAGHLDLVGNKIARDLQHQDMSTSPLTIRRQDLQSMPVLSYEHGERFAIAAAIRCARADSRRHILRTGQTLVINENMSAQAELEIRQSSPMPGTPASREIVGGPVLQRATGSRRRSALMDHEHEHAFSRFRRAPAADAGQRA